MSPHVSLSPPPAPSGSRGAARRRLLARAAVVALALLIPVLAGCGGDDGAAGGTTTATTEAPDGGTDPSAPEDEDEGEDPGEAGDDVLRVVVTNDDGVDAAGIDAVVEALEARGDVEVHVVAPLDQRSATGGTFIEGDLDTQEAETASGRDAIAVDGYPADSVRVAIDELGLDPHLVVSGINEGQNVGQIVDISGTVGAARAGVARGIPALALSSGTTGFDYEAAVPFMLEWIDERFDALLAGEAPVEVASINVPSCAVGEVRGLVEVPVATGGNPLQDQDCTSTLEDPPDDTTAFLNGFASLTVVPDEPATPPEPADPDE